jgi:hypothetical protein
MPALREIYAEYDIRFDPRGQLPRGRAAVTDLRQRLQGLVPLADAARSAFLQLGAAIGAAALVRGTARFVVSTMNMGDALDDTSQQLGLTVRQLQAFQHAAGLAGVDSTAFALALRTLQTNTAAAATGGGEAAASFRRLGVEVRDANGELRPGNAILLDVARQLSAVEDSAERVALAQQLMGRSGRRMIPMLAELRDGAGGVEAELDRLGGGMSELAVRQSVSLTHNLARLRLAFVSIRSVIATRVFPVVDRAVVFMTRLAAGIGRVVDRSHILSATLVVLIGTIAATVSAAIAMNPAAAATALAFAGLVAVLVLLALALDDVMVGLDGGKSLTREWIDDLGEMIGIVNAGETAFKALGAALEWVETMWMRAHAAFAGFTGFGAFIDTDSYGQEQANIHRGASSLRAQAIGGYENAAGRNNLPGQNTIARFLLGAADSVAGLVGGGGSRDIYDAAAGQRRSRGENLAAAAHAVQAPGARYIPQAAPPVQNIEAPMTVNVVANEATDAQEVGRIVAARVREEQARQNREIQAVLVPATLAPATGTGT